MQLPLHPELSNTSYKYSVKKNQAESENPKESTLYFLNFTF